MSFTFLREQGEESSAECFSDIPRCVLSRLNLTAEESYFNGSGTESCHDFPSGMTSEHSTEPRGEAESMSSAVVFPVRTFPSQAKELGSTESVPACGPKWPASFAKWDPVSSSWRTRQLSLLGGLAEFSETWPKWGTTVAGAAYLLKTPSGLVEHRRSIIAAKGCGFSGSMPTAKASDGTRGDCPSERARNSPSLVSACQSLPTPAASKASNDLTLQCSGDGRSKPNKLGWAVAVMSVPTPHGFSKDGKSNGPSGNELGRAVNRSLRVPTPTKCQFEGSSQAALTRKDGSDRTNDRLDHFVMATTGGSLNPTWVEWLMNWPLTWTAVEPMEMEMFDEWRAKTTGKEDGTSGDTFGAVPALRQACDGSTPSRPLEATGGCSSVPEVPLEGRCDNSFTSGESRCGDQMEGPLNGHNVPALRSGVHEEKSQTDDMLSVLWKQAGMESPSWWLAEPSVGRVAVGVADRVDRLKAIGNGQVPLSAALAWVLLSRTEGRHDSTTGGDQ